MALIPVDQMSPAKAAEGAVWRVMKRRFGEQFMQELKVKIGTIQMHEAVQEMLSEARKAELSALAFHYADVSYGLDLGDEVEF